MSLVFDGILLLIAVIAIVSGYKKGFVRSVMNLVTAAAAFLAAYAFTPRLAAYIEEKFVLEKISSDIADTLGSLSLAGNGQANLVKMFADMPEALSNMLGRYHADTAAVTSSVTDTSTVDEVAKMIASPVSSAISTAAAFLIIFVAAVIVLKIVTVILDAIFKLPLLNGANKMLGLLFGAATAVVIIWAISVFGGSLISALGSVAPEYFGDKVIENSFILQFFHKFNIFGGLLPQ